MTMRHIVRRRLGRCALALACIALMAADSSDRWAPPQDCRAAREHLPPYSKLAEALRFDTATPVPVNVTSTNDDGALTAQTIEFDESGGHKCSAELIFPDNSGKYPAVVWLGSGDKQWEPDALDFSKLGAVSLLLDWCGNAPFTEPQKYYEQEIQGALNVRRAVNILSARKDVDRERIAFVGHSGGGLLGADAVAVDKRFKAAVFESGLQGFTYHICTSPHPFAVGVREELKGQLFSFVAALAPLDTILYVGHLAPTALLFQSGRLDKGVQQSDAKALYDAASNPKQLKWYDAGHKMDLPEVSKDRTEFLKKELGMQ